MGVTVSMCAYVHLDDVNIERRTEEEPVNQAMTLAVTRAIEALDHPTNGYSEFHRSTIQAIFSSMLSTHGLIRHVLAAGWQNPASVDALMLARGALESLYSLSLMFENASWVDGYLRDGWKKDYIRFLLTCEETKRLTRFHKFCAERQRDLDALRPFINITDAEVATIENEELGAPLPPGMTPARIRRFPTPALTIGELPPGDKRRILERLYLEYVWLCSFTHGLPDAVLSKQMFNARPLIPHMHSEQHRKGAFQRNVVDPAYGTSFLGLIQAATELAGLYPADVELRAALVNVWSMITDGWLVARGLWSIRAKNLLGVVG